MGGFLSPGLVLFSALDEVLIFAAEDGTLPVVSVHISAGASFMVALWAGPM